MLAAVAAVDWTVSAEGTDESSGLEQFAVASWIVLSRRLSCSRCRCMHCQFGLDVRTRWQAGLIGLRLASQQRAMVRMNKEENVSPWLYLLEVPFPLHLLVHLCMYVGANSCNRVPIPGISVAHTYLYHLLRTPTRLIRIVLVNHQSEFLLAKVHGDLTAQS